MAGMRGRANAALERRTIARLVSCVMTATLSRLTASAFLLSAASTRLVARSKGVELATREGVTMRCKGTLDSHDGRTRQMRAKHSTN